MLTAAFELYFKSDLSLPRLGALRCTPCTVRLCWDKASLGVRLAARFVLLLVRVRRSWGCGRVGAAATPASSPARYYKQKTKVFKGYRYAAINTKKLFCAAYCASPEQCLRSAGTKVNFGAVKICLFAQEITPIHKIFKDLNG